MLRCLALGAGLALVAFPLEAQRRAAPAARAASTNAPRVGPHLGYNFDTEELLVGAHFALPVAQGFELYPSFDYHLVDGGTLWALNFDARYRPPLPRGMLYVGGGVNYMRASAGGFSAGDTNINMFGGVEMKGRRLSPYGEARFTLGDGSTFQLVGGLNISLR